MTSTSQKLVQLALKTLSCNQKELAEKLVVSTSQVSKWKTGESMSHDMQDKLAALLNLQDSFEAGLVAATGSVEDTAKWRRLVEHLAARAAQVEGTGFDTLPLQEPNEYLLLEHTLDTLQEMGVAIPVPFPAEIERQDYAAATDELEIEGIEFEKLLLDRNPYSSLIYSIYSAYTGVWAFHAAYVSGHLLDDELGSMFTEAPTASIEPELLSLAASKLDLDETQYPGLREFKAKVNRNFREWLGAVKETCIRARVPLRAELLDMVNLSDEELRREAEKESLGLNDRRVHPDIYVNELIIGMRMVHQILPAIIEKLGVKPELDWSEMEG